MNEPMRSGGAPPFRCSRLLSWPDVSSQCPSDATVHVIWTPECDNGLVCDRHALEARWTWTYEAMHPYEMACSMPGAQFVHDENRCVPPEGDQVLVAEAALVAPVSPSTEETS